MRKSETMTTDIGKTGEPAALTDKELDTVTGGGTVDHSEFRIVKLLDAATPKLAGGGHVSVFSGRVADPA
jgi:bacteriocin-like protein